MMTRLGVLFASLWVLLCIHHVVEGRPQFNNSTQLNAATNVTSEDVGETSGATVRAEVEENNEGKIFILLKCMVM